MTRNYPPTSLGGLLIQHDNDYGFDSRLVEQRKVHDVPTLTIAIPYFEAKSTINPTLECLFRSLDSICTENPAWRFEVLVVDDGSINYPLGTTIHPKYKSRIRISSHPRNQGRCVARNTAIREARHEFLLFLDADVLINQPILEAHLNIYSTCRRHDRYAITASMFYTSTPGELDSLDDMAGLFEKTNDFRIDCVYRESWIGCDDDKRFIGQKFEIMNQTNYLKHWPESGFLGPWMLSNMVLGGLFGVPTALAKQVGGCDRLFTEYGFEETSLVTKLICAHKSYVIPITVNSAIHLSDHRDIITRNEKDYFFQISHSLYCDTYLFYDFKQAIEAKI